jgi:hypothetical protein
MSPEMDGDFRMMRIVAAGIVVALAASPCLAANAKIDAAVKTFQSVGADPAKLKVFCEMQKAMDAAGEKEDAAADAKIDGYMQQLGSAFQAAWNAGNDLEENSPDGKTLDAAIDALASKCH